MNGKVLAGLVAAGHSAYFTFAGVTAGFLTVAYSAGARTPADFLAYGKANWLGFLVINLVCPALRGGHAAATTTITAS